MSLGAFPPSQDGRGHPDELAAVGRARESKPPRRALLGYDRNENVGLIFELLIAGSNGWSRDDVHALLALVRAGSLKPVIHPQRFSIEQGHDAMRLLDERQVFGKVVVEG